MRMFTEAATVLAQALGDYPGNRGLEYLHGRLWEMRCDDERAVHAYRRLLARDPDHVDALCSLGCIYERRGDLDRALACFTQAVHTAPENPRIIVNRAIIMGRLGMHADAERFLREVVSTRGDFGAAHNALGWHLANQQRYREAVPHFKKAVELEPHNVRFHVNLGLAFEKMNRFDEAVAVYERAAFLRAHADPRTRAMLEPFALPRR
jgi:Flp pilus assembly protein TadD